MGYVALHPLSNLHSDAHCRGVVAARADHQRPRPQLPQPLQRQHPNRLPPRHPGLVRLEIYNVLGQPVRTLVNQFQPAGFYQVRWDARDQRGAAVAAGVYLTRLRHPDGAQTRRLLYLK